MRSLRTKLQDRATLEALIQAHHRASEGKWSNSEILRFNLNETGNLLRILDILRTGQYYPSQPRTFQITRPKLRTVVTLPYPDRVIHQWLVHEFLAPYYLPRFIYDSYGSLPGKGMHARR